MVAVKSLLKRSMYALLIPGHSNHQGGVSQALVPSLHSFWQHSAMGANSSHRTNPRHRVADFLLAGSQSSNILANIFQATTRSHLCRPRSYILSYVVLFSYRIPNNLNSREEPPTSGDCRPSWHQRAGNILSVLCVIKDGRAVVLFAGLGCLRRSAGH